MRLKKKARKAHKQAGADDKVARRAAKTYAKRLCEEAEVAEKARLEAHKAMAHRVKNDARPEGAEEYWLIELLHELSLSDSYRNEPKKISPCQRDVIFVVYEHWPAWYPVDLTLGSCTDYLVEIFTLFFPAHQLKRIQLQSAIFTVQKILSSNRPRSENAYIRWIDEYCDKYTEPRDMLQALYDNAKGHGVTIGELWNAKRCRDRREKNARGEKLPPTGNAHRAAEKKRELEEAETRARKEESKKQARVFAMLDEWLQPS